MRYKRTYIDPSIELIDSTDSNLSFLLWMESRSKILSDLNGSKLGESFLNELFNGTIDESMSIKVGSEVVKISEYKKRVAHMGLQYNNFGQYVFKIHGSCLFRDILFNINKIAQWAESNRFLFSILDENEVYNSVHYYISSEYKDVPEWEEQFDRYMDAIAEDKVVDHNRLEMPYSISSKFWISINRNTAVSLLSFLKYHAPFFYGVYGKSMMNIIGIAEDELHESIDVTISQLIRGDQSTEENVNHLGKFTLVNSRMGLILYSQFIRQTDTIISGLYDLVMHEDINDFKSKVFKGSTEFMITYMAHEDKVRRTVSNRLCAFAMSSGDKPSSWSYFLNNFLKNVTSPLELAKLLPCKFYENGSNGISMVKCKFHDDIKFRNEGKELSNCPCPLVSKSMDDAEVKRSRDNNKIGDLFYKLTEQINNGINNCIYHLNMWTSDLIIRTETPLSDDTKSEIYNALSVMGSYYPDYNEIAKELEKYRSYGLGNDLTCLMKGHAIDFIAFLLTNLGHKSYIINFGGDIYMRNSSAIIHTDNENVTINLSGNYSIFTSGNTDKRGDHIVGCPSGRLVTVIVEWFSDDYDNTEVDILATKLAAGETTKADDLKWSLNKLGRVHSITMDESHIVDTTYIASPFFNPIQVETRDKMTELFKSTFRPDLTESSKLYDQNHNDMAGSVVSDNISGIESSSMLVFPMDTDDLGTLFEVGYAMANHKPIIKYLRDKYEIVLPKISKSPENKKHIFDCSSKSGAISLGYSSKFLSKDNIYYELKGNRDNIMLSVNYNHVELVNNQYELIIRDENDRDQ